MIDEDDKAPDCCEVCEFWRDVDKYADEVLETGVCARFPPSAAPTPHLYTDRGSLRTKGSARLFTQPVTTGLDWCGGFKRDPARA